MITEDVLIGITCDCCGKRLPNHRGGNGFQSIHEAVAGARQMGWRIGRTKHVCYQCYKERCRREGEKWS